MSPLRFRNLDGRGPNGPRDIFKWMVTDTLTGKRRRAPAHYPMKVVTPDFGALATPPAAGAPARLTWIGHASWLVQLDGVSLLIDPVLSTRLSGVVRRNVAPGIPFEKLPRIDAQLVSHNHYDHLDMPTLRRVGAPVIAGAGMTPTFARTQLTCTELEWWQSTNVGGVKVTFVPSQHWSRRGLADTNETLWGGFIVEGSQARLYHSGDTAYFEGFKEIGKRFPGIDAAMLPIGAYDPEWFMRTQHINPEEVTQAFIDLGAREFLAMHWGTFKLTDEPLDEPPQRLEAEWVKRGLEPEHRHVLAIGQTIDIRPGAAS